MFFMGIGHYALGASTVKAVVCCCSRLLLLQGSRLLHPALECPREGSPRGFTHPGARSPAAARERFGSRLSPRRDTSPSHGPVRAVRPSCYACSSAPRAWLAASSSSPCLWRRSTRLFPYGGPRRGERRDASVGSPSTVR